MNGTQSSDRPLRQAREARSLSQADLAAAVGISRQSLLAIESGRAMPRVDVALRIARVLGAAAESLFAPRAERARLIAEGSEPDLAKGERVALTHIDGRWLAYPLRRALCGQAAEGVVRRPVQARSQTRSPSRSPSQVEIELLTSEQDAQKNIVIMGCAPALGLLAERLNQRSAGGRFLWLPTSSTFALQALAKKQTQIAGVHLIDPRTGQQNLPDVMRQSGSGRRSLIALAGWEVGLVLQKGNPLRISSLAALMRPRRGTTRRRPPVRWIAREPGAGVQRYVEQARGQAGKTAGGVLSPVGVARSHLEVAQAVAMGVADVGLASQDAARALCLDFVPIAEERYDLALPNEALADPRIARVFDTLCSVAFRRELRALGYDIRSTGNRVGEVLAA
ncbi:MAG: helix-turn-helix domain-containing protein [Myxococcales bacterium]|nr:helix-turn-helix domain-containing protein [Myxococcales bacterium]